MMVKCRRNRLAASDDISEALNANKDSGLRVFPVSILEMGKIAVALA